MRFVAAVLERAGEVSVATADLADGQAGSFQPGPARRFSAAQAMALRAFLKDQKIDVVIRVAPTAEALGRPAAVPENITDRDALADALALVAESELPAHLPWYRRTGGLITPAPGATAGGWALLLGWHRGASRGGATPPGSDQLAAALEGFRQIWTTEVVAIARLLRAAGGPAQRWIASLDRAAGTVAIAASDGQRLGLRVLRAPGAEAGRWTAAVTQAVTETLAALNAGEATGPERIDPDAALALSPGLAVRVAGRAHDPAWLDQFAVPAALVETFADPDPAVRSLFNLHELEPRRRLGLVRGLVAFLASPARAAAVIALCVLALVLTPLGVAYARYTTLQRHVQGVSGLSEQLTAAEHKVNFYSLLREKRWPMTKLLADIAASTPEGITLDMLELNQGEQVTLRGTAKSSAGVTKFRENLAQTRVFDSIATPQAQSTEEGVQFQLQARVSPTGALHRGNLPDDFAKKPLGVRMYGDSWTASGEERPAPAPRRDRTRPERASSSGRAAGPERSASGGTPARSPSPGSSPGAGAPPPAPLSDEDIAKLDRGKTVIEFALRKSAAAKSTVDAPTKERLQREVEKLLKHKDDLDAKGGGQ